MGRLTVSAYTCATALGCGVEALASGLQERRGGLAPVRFDTVGIPTYTGQLAGIEDRPVTERLAVYDCRNNRLAQAALESDGFAERVVGARERYGPERVAVLMGTSTSGMYELELAYRRRDAETGALPKDVDPRYTQNPYAITDFVRAYLRLEGPAYTIATACSSSAKVFAAAYRLMRMGFCDAAVVGGIDSMCMQTLYGFHGLQVLSEQPCRPYAADRKGISIGEGGGMALVERGDLATDSTGIALLGYGESADAYHMSAPCPDGAGAALSMRRALDSAGLAADGIDYVNLHGTGTPSNDVSEDAAVMAVFGDAVPCGATKGWVGHTLGAAGIVESIICFLALRDGFMPGTLNTTEVDPEVRIRLLLDNADEAPRRVLTNSFGFGGSNCSLIFGLEA